MDEIQEFVRQVEAVKVDGDGLLTGLSDRQFNWRPEPGRWSIGQCIDHLNTAVRKTFPAFDGAIAEARAGGITGAGPFTYGRFANWMIASMEPPPRWRFKVSKIFVPSEATDLSVAALRVEFVTVRDGLIARLRSAAGLDLRRAKITSPVSRFLRLSLGAYFAFVIAHERRHLWQGRQVRERLPGDLA